MTTGIKRTRRARERSVNGEFKTRAVRIVAITATLAALCLPASQVRGQHGGGQQRRSEPQHFPAPRSERMQPGHRGEFRPEYRFQPPERGRMQNIPSRPQNQLFPLTRPEYPGAAGARGALNGPPQPAFNYPGAAPPGHLGSWLNQHDHLSVQQQERLLRSDPSFKRLPSGDQQRLMQQLQQVDKMPAQQRERRLARSELLEHMSPEERMRINLSARRWATMPSARQALMKNAFRDLREVPPDQRQTVLNSQRYQNMFSPEERGVLSDLLRAEPYMPPR